VEVRAFDGDDEGPADTAWVVIGNTPVTATGPLEDIVIPEDGSDNGLLLTQVFSDPDVGLLTYTWETDMDNVVVEINEITGRVTITPSSNWWGQGDITFRASDGETTAEQTVHVVVEPRNDIPYFETVNGESPPEDTYSFTVRHGEELVVTFTVHDIDGDDLTVTVDSADVDLGEEELGYIPPTDFVGEVTFTLTLRDSVQPGQRVSITFHVTVENVNDPPDPPNITSPLTRNTFRVNETFRLRGECFDPDQMFGQVLTFTWTSNISGPLGTGTNFTVSISEPGTHLVTLTVSDGEFQKSATIELVIEPEAVGPPPGPPDNGDDGDGGDGDVPAVLWLVIVAVVVIVVIAAALMAMRGREAGTEEVEAPQEEEVPPEEEPS
jgi:hypothetical protein